MKAYSIKLEGFDQLKKRIKQYPQEIVTQVDGELEAAAENIAADAQQAAPVDLGQLQNSILPVTGEKMHKEVVVSAPHAAYVEFGTGAKVMIPPGLEEYAAQFKGKTGGTFEEMVEAIKGWCTRHGIDPKAAYPIALNILRNGRAPQPFLFPAVEAERPKLIQRLKSLLGAK